MEEAIGDSLLGGAESLGDTLASLQKIDLVVQSLGELSAYVDELAAALPCDPYLDMDKALGQISLRDLARTLSGGARKKVVNSDGETSGEVELF